MTQSNCWTFSLSSTKQLQLANILQCFNPTGTQSDTTLVWLQRLPTALAIQIGNQISMNIPWSHFEDIQDGTIILAHPNTCSTAPQRMTSANTSHHTNGIFCCPLKCLIEQLAYFKACHQLFDQCPFVEFSLDVPMASQLSASLAIDQGVFEARYDVQGLAEPLPRPLANGTSSHGATVLAKMILTAKDFHTLLSNCMKWTCSNPLDNNTTNGTIERVSSGNTKCTFWLAVNGEMRMHFSADHGSVEVSLPANSTICNYFEMAKDDDCGDGMLSAAVGSLKARRQSAIKFSTSMAQIYWLKAVCAMSSSVSFSFESFHTGSDSNGISITSTVSTCTENRSLSQSTTASAAGSFIWADRLCLQFMIPWKCSPSKVVFVDAHVSGLALTAD